MSASTKLADIGVGLSTKVADTGRCCGWTLAGDARTGSKPADAEAGTRLAAVTLPR